MTKKIILKLLYIYSFIAKIPDDELLRQSDKLQIWGSISLSDVEFFFLINYEQKKVITSIWEKFDLIIFLINLYYQFK